MVTKASTATSYTKTEVDGLLSTKASTGGTAAQFIKANGTFDSNTYLTTTGTAADSSKLNGKTAVQLFNNMGDSHGLITSFDATSPSYDYGFRYVQGSVNGPGTGGTQFFSWYIGLGAEYVGTGGGANNFGAMFAVDRDVTRPYLSVRYCNGNTFTTWRRMASGYADVAGSFEGGTQFTSTRGNNTATNGGQILLNGSSGNKIVFFC